MNKQQCNKNRIRKSCLVPTCKSGTVHEYLPDNIKKITYYRVPVDEKRAKLWFKLCARADRKKETLPRKYDEICSLHFCAHQYSLNSQRSCINRLKKDAFPCCYLPSKEKCKCSEKAADLFQKKKLEKSLLGRKKSENVTQDPSNKNHGTGISASKQLTKCVTAVDHPITRPTKELKYQRILPKVDGPFSSPIPYHYNSGKKKYSAVFILPKTSNATKKAKISNDDSSSELKLDEAKSTHNIDSLFDHSLRENNFASIYSNSFSSKRCHETLPTYSLDKKPFISATIQDNLHQYKKNMKKTPEGDSKVKLRVLEMQNRNHLKTICALNKKLQRNREVFHAKEIILKKIIKQLTDSVDEYRSILNKYFSEAQLSRICENSKSKKNWSRDDIINATSLYSVSKKCFRYLQNVMKIPLPCETVIREWIKTESQCK